MIKRVARQVKSWSKQEALALSPRQRQRLARASVLLMIGLLGLNMQRRYNEQIANRDIDLQRGRELAAAQWNTIRATAYDWAHWDETHAFALGAARGYPARNLEVANGLSSVAPVVAVLNRERAVLTLQGRGDQTTWSEDPLVRCSQHLAELVHQTPKTIGISCRDQDGGRVWIGVLEPITDTEEQDEHSGVMVLLAPLRHPSNGKALQNLMLNLEQQLELIPPGPQAMSLNGQVLRTDKQTVLGIKAKSVLGPTITDLGRDLALAGPFALLFLSLRGCLMLQRRARTLDERRQERRSRQRLRRARQQLDALCGQVPVQEQENRLRQMATTTSDIIDDLARRLEAYNHALLKQHGQSNDASELRYEPLWNRSGELQRLKIQTTPHPHEDLKAAVAGWASLPTEWRSRIGLQLSTSAQNLVQAEFSDCLMMALKEFGCPTTLCTVALNEGPISQPGDPDALIRKMLSFREQGIRLAWIYKGHGGDPAGTLSQLPVDELQIEIHPSIDSKQHEAEQALISALAQLAKAKGLSVSAIQAQSENGAPDPWDEWIDLWGGGHPEQTTHNPADLLMKKGQVSQPRET